MKQQYPFFVYGTLLAGEPNHYHFEDSITHIHPGTAVGCLYSLGSFPMMVNGNGLVTGQIIWVQSERYPEIIRSLDRLEGYNPHGKYNLYNRLAVPVTVCENGQQVTAWAYFGRQQQVDGRILITSGSWLEHKGNR